MDSTAKSQRKVLAAKAIAPAVESRASPRKNGRAAERMPELIAGKEVLGRKLSVIKTSKKEAIWVKGEVKDFDEPSVRHKIAYDLPLPEVLEQKEEWLCLAKEGFMWKDDDFVCPVANPTYSHKHTPKREDAIGKRVKVFWTAMSKWYQGKVVAYDPVTAKHKVSFRDGEQNEYLLQQEALVWLDIPQLSSDVALKKMRKEEGNPVAIIRDDENQAPVERQQPASLQPTPAPQANGKATSATPSKGGSKRKPKAAADGKGAQASPKPKPKRARSAQPKSTKAGCVKPEAVKAVKKTAEVTGAKRGREPGLGKGVEKNATKASPGKPTPDARKKVKKEEASPAVAALGPGPSKELTSAISITANGNGRQLPKVTLRGPAVRAGCEDGSRKRSRLGNLALAGPSRVAEQPAKRRSLGKPPAPGQGPKLHWKQRAAQEAAAALQKEKDKAAHVWTEHDHRFQECSERVLGARVGVWWEDDQCYYKGKVVAHDWFERQLRIHYDDGVEEHILPLCDKFRWLTPRAVTAGATNAVHSSFVYLRASNAVNATSQASTPDIGEATTAVPPAVASPIANGVPMHLASSPVSTSSTHTADGTHLDALVPMRSSKATVPATTSAQPVDSTIRDQHAAMAANGTANGVSVGAVAQNGMAMGQPLVAGTHSLAAAGLSRMVANGNHAGEIASSSRVPSHLPPLAPVLQKSGLARFATTPEPGARPAHPPVPKEAAAVGWKVSLVFRGDNQMFQGRILAYDAAKPQQHLVLWDDGEHEWIDVSQEQLTWHAGDRGQNPGFGAGLPAGLTAPKGYALEGWRLSVFWPRVKEFYEGTVTRYDPELNEHTISYEDGEERTEPIDTLVFKYVLNPTVNKQAQDSLESTAADSRAAEPRRRGNRRWRAEGSSERDDTPIERGKRPRRRQRAASYEDDSDYEEEEEDWTTELVVGHGCGTTSRAAARAAPYVPPIRHLNLGSTASRLSLAHQQVNSPVVRTPGGSDIRRMNSKCGSLLIFEGEENPLASPATSPRMAAPIAVAKPDAGAAQASVKPRPVLERRVGGLRSGQGFRVGVKRVRLYLQSLPKDEEPPLEGKEGGVAQGGAEVTAAKGLEVKAEDGAAGPDRESLKVMLERVEAASASMQNGVPAVQIPSSTVAQPPRPPPRPIVLVTQSSALESVNRKASESHTAADTKKELAAEVKQEQQHFTPPPSPFAGFQERVEDEAAPPLEDLCLDGGKPQPPVRAKSFFETVDELRAVPVLGKGIGSLSLPPGTPSIGSEAQMVALSRNGSVMSDPTLAELLHAKLAQASKCTHANGLHQVEK